MEGTNHLWASVAFLLRSFGKEQVSELSVEVQILHNMEMALIIQPLHNTDYLIS